MKERDWTADDLWTVFHLKYSFYSKSREKKEHVMEPMGLEFGASIKRQRMSPMCDRVMLYVRQENEDIYTPLHVVPPTTSGLLNAVSQFSILFQSIRN